MQVAEWCTKHGSSAAKVILCNLADPSQIDRLAATIEADHPKGLHVLVNNASGILLLASGWLVYDFFWDICVDFQHVC